MRLFIIYNSCLVIILKIARFVYGNMESLGFVIKECMYPFSEFNNLPNYISSPFVDEKDIESILSLDEKMILNATCIPIKNVRLVNPVKYPGKIICLGLNYIDHVEEAEAKPPEDIVIFLKPRTALAGPYDIIHIPHFIKQLDYEGELAVVIGRKGKNISVEEAYSYVLGYTILNDVSARDLQFKDRQWTRGKGLDGFAPTGPWIVTRDEVGDPHSLSIKTWVNDEVRQDSSTSKMIFKIPEIVNKISMVFTLEPGDIISTGTPSGVGYFDKSGGKLIKDNDIVKIEIDKIGFIENRFRFT